MKYWLIQIATEDGDMDAVKEQLDASWEPEGDDVLANKVQGVTEFGVRDHRFKVGDKIPGEIHPHGKFADGTVGSLIEALKTVDPTGEREVKIGHTTPGGATHAEVKADGKVYLGNIQLPPLDKPHGEEQERIDQAEAGDEEWTAEGRMAYLKRCDELGIDPHDL